MPDQHILPGLDEEPQTTPPLLHSSQVGQPLLPGLEDEGWQSRDRMRQQLARLEQSRQQAAPIVNSDNPLEFVARRSLALGSALGNFADQNRYGDAIRRFNANRAEDRDYQTIAEYEARQQREANRGTVGRVLSGVARIPAIVQEARLGGGLGLVAQTARMPSIYLENVGEANLANNRSPLDPRGFLTQFPKAVIENAIFQSMGHWGQGITAEGVRGTAYRTLANVGGGLMAQQSADILSSSIGRLSGIRDLDTGFGTIGQLVSGHRGEALQKTVVDALIFASFHGMHQHQAAELVRQQLYESQANDLNRRVDRMLEEGQPSRPGPEGSLSTLAPGQAQAQPEPPPEAPTPPQTSPPAPGGPIPASTPPNAAANGSEAPPPLPPMTPEQRQGWAGYQPVPPQRGLRDVPPVTEAERAAAAAEPVSPGRQRAQERLLERMRRHQQDVPTPEQPQDLVDTPVGRVSRALAEQLGYATKPKPKPAEAPKPSEMFDWDAGFGETPQPRELTPQERLLERMRGRNAPTHQEPPQAPRPMREFAATEEEPPTEERAPVTEAHAFEEGLRVKPPDMGGGNFTPGEPAPRPRSELEKVPLEEWTTEELTDRWTELRTSHDDLARRLEEEGPDGHRAPQSLADDVGRVEAETRRVVAELAQRGPATPTSTHHTARGTAPEAAQRVPVEPASVPGAAGVRVPGRRAAAAAPAQEQGTARAAEGNREAAAAASEPQAAADQLTPWLAQAIENNYNAARHIGAVDEILRRAANRESGANIARDMRGRLQAAGLDPGDARAMVNAVRARHGVPSMDEPTAFEAWRKDFLAAAAPGLRQIQTPSVPESEWAAGTRAEDQGMGQDTWRGSEPVSDAELQRLVREGKIAPAPGEPGRAALMAQHAVDQAKRFGQRVLDGVRELAGQMFPRTSRLSPESGNSLSRMVSANIYAHEITPLLLDRVMGNAEPFERLRVGATLTERRLRYMKQMFLERGEQEKADAVRTIVGQANSPFHNEAEYQAALKDPTIREAINRFNREVVPVMEGQFRQAQGLGPEDAINTYTQIPGEPVHLVRGETGETVVRTGAGDSLRRPKLRKYGFANEASGAAPGYDIDLGSIIEHSIGQYAQSAAQAEMYRTLEKAGLARWVAPGQNATFDGVPAKVFRDVMPPKGTQAAEKGQIHLAVHPDVYSEVYSALSPERPWSKAAGSRLLTSATLMSTVEMLYHGKNLATMYYKPGMSLNPLQYVKSALDVVRGNQEVRGQMAELARIGAMKDHAERPGLFTGTRLDTPLNPLTWGHRFLNVMDRTMRVEADNAFNRLADRGLVPNTEANRRDFINQLGQYNKRAQNRAVRLLRETGIGPFATAGTNYAAQGVKALTLNPGVQATSYANAARLRGEYLLKLAAVPVAVGMANYLMWGRMDGDDNTPVGGLKVGTEKGKTQYFDLMGMTGVTRGMRLLGVHALLEGMREGAQGRGTTGADIRARAVDEAVHSILHPVAGPIVNAGYIAYTGRNTLGKHVVPQTQRDPVTGRSQAAQGPYLGAAALEANPVLGALLNPGRDESVAARLMGPFGLKESAGPPGQPHRQITIPMPTPEQRQARRLLPPPARLLPAARRRS